MITVVGDAYEDFSGMALRDGVRSHTDSYIYRSLGARRETADKDQREQSWDDDATHGNPFQKQPTGEDTPVQAQSTTNSVKREIMSRNPAMVKAKTMRCRNASPPGGVQAAHQAMML